MEEQLPSTPNKDAARNKGSFAHGLQKSLLPFTIGTLILLGIFFLIASTYQLNFINNRIDWQGSALANGQVDRILSKSEEQNRISAAYLLIYNPLRY